MIPLLKGGQNRNASHLLACWPGLFRIWTIGLVIAACVLVGHVLERRRIALAHLHALQQPLATPHPTP